MACPGNVLGKSEPPEALHTNRWTGPDADTPEGRTFGFILTLRVGGRKETERE